MEEFRCDDLSPPFCWGRCHWPGSCPPPEPAPPSCRVYRVVAVDSERRLIAASPAAKPQPAL